MKLSEAGKNGAVHVIQSCIRPIGFYASGLPHGYEALWARDSMITSLGASLAGKKFRIPFRKSLALLSVHQSELGQIPNAVGTYNTERRSDVTYNSIDSSLWYLIGHAAYARAYGDRGLLRAYRKSIAKARLWLKYQDPNEDTLLAQQPTMDWQDAMPHKYGHVLNTQALHYAVLRMYGEHVRAEHMKGVVNGRIEKYLALYDQRLGYYLPWAWKNHDGDREREEWFDSLGNFLAIVTGLATPKIAKAILRHAEREHIVRPFPAKSLYPPIKETDKEWRSYFARSELHKPYDYLNGGIWPMIGGFYVAALVKAGMHKKAASALEKLAAANKQGTNREWEFNEWLSGRTGKPKGTPYQAWSAGAYLFAHESVTRKRVPFFA